MINLYVIKFNTLAAVFFLPFIGFSQTAPSDVVHGNLIQFNDNGAWCWYQDERAVIDLSQQKMIIGSDASQAGPGGSPRNGVIDAVIFDLQTRTSTRYDLAKFSCDDHNAPAFIIRADGKYLAMYAEHYDYYNSRYRIFNGSSWTPEQRFDWTTIPGGTDYTIAYSNLYYLSAEGRMYNFARANHRTPNLIYSMDHGDTWVFGGQLTTNSSNSYNKGYYKYWGNGVNRIDFIFTEQHPRDTSTSIYHGYLKDGRSHASDGTVVDNNIFDTLNLPTFKNFTKVFADNTVVNGVAMRRCWNTDVMRYDDGTIVTIVTARDNNNQGGGSSGINPDHSFIYCRYNGASWSYSHLGKAGFKLYPSEQDYTGLAAVHPNNPDVIYISTHYDPRDNTSLNKREIFKGTTDDNGSTWTWTPVTWNSTRDNIRPIVPYWDEEHTALLWMRGTYNAAQNFDLAIVGVLESTEEPENLMTFVDATTLNTTQVNGSSATPNAPSSGEGADDDQWHIRTGIGNGESVITSSEIWNGEDAPRLKTVITVPGPGNYDIWVNFWANPAADWRIKTSLSEDNMQVFRSMACKQVDPGRHTSLLTLNESGSFFLYQAYLGRVQVTTSNTIEVFIDDEAIQTGTVNTMIGNAARTWYDGVSYASVLSLATSASVVEVEATNGSTASVDITTALNWTALSTETWLSIEPPTGVGNGTINMVAEENTTGMARIASIEIAAEGIVKYVTIVQLPNAAPTLTISNDAVSIEASHGSSVTIAITSNTFWSVSSSESWLNVSPTWGTNDGEITVTGDGNPSGAGRTATVTITAEGLETTTILVTQEPGAITSSVDDIFNNTEIHPNPATDNIKVRLSGEPVELRLFTVTGSPLSHVRTTEKALEMNVASYTPGIYILQINMRGKIIRRKIIKQ